MLEVGIEKTETNAEQIELVEFILGTKTFGIDIKDVQEIIHSRPITFIPKSSPLISGMIEWNGRALPVVNLEAVTEEKSIHNPRLEKMVVVNVNTDTFVVRVDQVLEITAMKQNQLVKEDSAFVSYRLEREKHPLFMLNLSAIIQSLKAN